MPTHGRRGLERFLLGSTTERVVRRADVPVLTLSPDDDAKIAHPYQDVLVLTDGSDCANQALTIGVDVAETEGAALHLLSAIAIAALGVDVRTDIQMDLLEESATKLLDEAEKFASLLLGCIGELPLDGIHQPRFQLFKPSPPLDFLML